MHAPKVRERVPRGQGSIIFDHEGAPCTDKYHRYCRGRWRGVLGKGFGPDGRRRRYKVGGRTKQDVIEALTKKSEELDARLSTSRSDTAGRAARDWLEHGLPGRSERTREVYRDALAPLPVKIGKRPLRDLTAGEAEAGLGSFAGTLSSRSLRMAHNWLRRAIRYAEANGTAGRNVAALIDTRRDGSVGAGGGVDVGPDHWPVRAYVVEAAAPSEAQTPPGCERSAWDVRQTRTRDRDDRA